MGDTRGGCPWCSGNNQSVYHTGICPKVKAIEYQADGFTIKRIEFHAPQPIVSIDPTRYLVGNEPAPVMTNAIAGESSQRGVR